ncbi:MAG: hypothetical protein ACK4E0_14455 [Chitinophagaceae bacterium]
MIKGLLASLVLVSIFSCSPNADSAKPGDHANIQGTWLAETESVNGISKQVDFQYTFNKDTLTFIDEKGMVVKYPYTLDTSSNPRYIVIKPLDAPADAAPVSVGYELNGNSLKIVVAPAGLRPTEISDKNDQELIICKRKDF